MIVMTNTGKYTILMFDGVKDFSNSDFWNFFEKRNGKFTTLDIPVLIGS